jgi:heterodisulfide reductase subunit A
VDFIRGIPGEIIQDPETDDLILIGENMLLGQWYKYQVDMVILSVGIEPRRDGKRLQQILNLSTGQDGFFLEAHPKLKPVDTASSGIFLAGCAEGPKDVKDSVTQASAAAARAGILMSRGEVTIEAITARIDPEVCTGCGMCMKVCPYNAIEKDEETGITQVVEASCAGCGTCAAECQFGAVRMLHFSDDQIYAQISTATEKEPEKKIVAFCCNWCSYAGADFAGVSRLQYPANARIIRTMCSGRVSPDFVRFALARGAGAVLVSGCHPADCHYINANMQTEKRIRRLHKEMRKSGLNPERLRLEWVSAAEGQRFASVMEEMSASLKKVSEKELLKTREAYEKYLKKRASK